jgi:putative OPT family oligopeptide transporter
MMVGGVVCTALAASGALASDLKIGHWIGATPARQLGLKFVGTVVAAIFCGIAMWLLSQSGDGFGTKSIPAPQASAMKEILLGIFGTTHLPLQWYTFSMGVIFALILRIIGVPALAFALGMYLPMELNTPVLLGGILSWIVGRRSKRVSAEVAKLRLDRGILIASGLIAGGALMGVFDAFLGVVLFGGDLDKKASLHLLSEHAFEGVTGEAFALIGVVALCLLVVLWSKRAAK